MPASTNCWRWTSNSTRRGWPSGWTARPEPSSGTFAAAMAPPCPQAHPFVLQPQRGPRDWLLQEGHVDGKEQQADGQQLESQHRQEEEEAPSNEEQPKRDPHNLRLRVAQPPDRA